MASLKRRAISGVLWASVGSIGNGLLNIIVTAVLARILVPSDFGVLELIIVVSSISAVIVDSGFSQALIRDKNASDTDKSTVFYINLAISVLLYVILYAIAPLLARFFNADNFDTYCRIAFLSILFDSFSIVQNANFTKELQFRPIAIATITGILLSGATAVCLAKIGYGVWALVWMIVLNSVVKSTMLWIMSQWKPCWTFSTSSMKRYWKFGSFILVQSIIDKLSLDLESLVIGKFYKKSQLGFFSQSRKINSYFCHALTNVVVKVSYPALVQIGDSDEKLKYGYRKIVGQTTFIVSPIMIFLLFFPYLSMTAIFGNQWTEAGKYLQIWACIGFIVPVQSICNNIFLVKGESKQLFYISAFKNISKIVIVVILAKVGIFAILQGIMFITIVTAFIFLFFSGKLIRYNLLEAIKDVGINVLMAIMACIPVYFLYTHIYSTHFSPMFVLGVNFSLMAILYFALCYIFKNPNVAELTSIIKSVITRIK